MTEIHVVSLVDVKNNKCALQHINPINETGALTALVRTSLFKIDSLTVEDKMYIYAFQECCTFENSKKIVEEHIRRCHHQKGT